MSPVESAKADNPASRDVAERRSRVILLFTLLAFILLPFASLASAASVTLAWSPNHESDVAGYKVYYGTGSRIYPHVADVGHNTSYTVSGLIESVTYYFAVTAYDAQGNESNFSEEVSYFVPSSDSDGDGVADSQDPFPYNPEDWNDTDADGIGDNSDTDDDADGMPDDWEVQHELDPLSNDASGDADDDGVSNLDEYLAGTHPMISPDNTPPEKPFPDRPADGASVDLTPELLVKEFIDTDEADSHAKTRWQIMTADDGNLVFDVSSTDALTAIKVPKLILEAGTEYLWRVSFYDDRGAPSQWSNEFAFIPRSSKADANENRIPDHQEIYDGTDLNIDGIADTDQNSIISLYVEGSRTQIGIGILGSTSVSSIISFQSENPDDPAEQIAIAGRPEDLPFGLISYKLQLKNPGIPAQLTVYLSEAAPADAVWYKYDALSGKWQDFSEHATISEDRLAVHITLQDGGFGDADGVANGIVVDPSGLGTRSVDNVSTTDSGDSGNIAGCFIATTIENRLASQLSDLLRLILMAAALNVLLGLVLVIRNKYQFFKN